MKLYFFYCFDKFLIVFRPAEQIDDLLQISVRIGISAQRFAHHIDGFEFIAAQQQILPPRAGFLYIDRGEYTIFLEMSVLYELHFCRSIKVLVHHVIHGDSRIDERRSEDR